ncbi:Bifunctional oligoribonuclease and PAP phosphatase NrnA [bioreactor metagenome]|uniref:Bifunctional oligoribonuclease and PAP phosphatase NrnA n=1 Tax=bioreactor metagenome TaxID=1076179 RepID=A0A645B5V7_9ZZZZ
MTTAEWPKETLARLLAAERPLLAAHLKPDGDAIGSTLGLAEFLRSCGKTPTVLLPDGIPELYRLRAAEFQTAAPSDWAAFDLAVLLDTAIAARAGFGPEGGVPEALRAKLLVIDHHPDNPGFGAWNCLQTVAATAEVVLQVCESSGTAIPRAAADWLLLGLVTDTGGFRFDNTAADTFRSAARLLDAGASLNRVVNQIFFNKPYRQQLFEAELLSHHVRWAENGRMAWAVVTPELLQKYDFDMRNAEGVIDMLRAIAGAEVVALISRRDPGFRVSMRSKNPAVPVVELAHKYHGGGHAMAAGMTVAAAGFEEVEAILERESANLFAGDPR